MTSASRDVKVNIILVLILQFLLEVLVVRHPCLFHDGPLHCSFDLLNLIAFLVIITTEKFNATLSTKDVIVVIGIENASVV